MKQLLFSLFVLYSAVLYSQKNSNTGYVKDNYTKLDTTITMRDGIKLYTVIYIPKDSSQRYPILMQRTPYSCYPYGSNNYPPAIMANDSLMREKYIYVKQDVRGRHMSEGVNEEVTPHIANKKSNKDLDESSDTFDTIEWLLKFLKNHTGRVGLFGISYPGFYATASLPGAHPAIKAVSPQAPVTDEFAGDDVNHNGAFFLMDNFSFMEGFDRPRSGPLPFYKIPIFPNIDYKDAYQFFLDMKTVKATNGPQFFNGKGKLWNEYLANDTYNDYWRSRNIRQHLKNITIPVLVVGGWFDAEDLFGALRTYQAIEQQSPVNKNFLVMGPWTHGAWSANEWTRFGTYEFGRNLNNYYRDSLETAFFNYYLKDKGSFNPSEATMFETGTNQWKHYAQWPPAEANPAKYYLRENGSISRLKAAATKSFSEYISDPAKPVPYTNGVYGDRNNEYMVEDQRFNATRPDVLVFKTDTLTEDLQIAGPIIADLFVSMTGTDADFVVKLIDVLPDNEPAIANRPRGTAMGGMQRLVRAEVIRGKFRNSLSKPEPFIPGKVAEVKFTLNDALHTFKKGHRIMVQVQSSWFPLVDRNPQQFLKIPEAKETDYRKATIRIWHDAVNPSHIVLPVVK
jgi:putative CocE/NonD family hydrolase